METKKWYKNQFVIIGLIILFFPAGLFLMWKYSNWNKKVKWGITGFFAFLVLIAAITPSPESKKESENKTATASTQVKPKTEEKKNYVFDIPSLVGKSFTEVEEALGKGKGSDPTSEQIALGTKEWSKEFEKSGIDLLVTYDFATKKVIDFFIGTDDPSGATTNKARLLELGKLNEKDSKYKVEFVKTLKDPSKYTGVKIIPSATATTSEVIKHEIVYSLKEHRYDKGGNYYVLIDPVDLSNDKFKTSVKELIKKLVKDKGGKNSFEIHDKKESLEVSYKQYGDLSLGRPRTTEEDELQAVHFVASFEGELDTELYKNTLRYFPGAFKNHATVGKYVETVEFNP